jgi:hypothetical protein
LSFIDHDIQPESSGAVTLTGNGLTHLYSFACIAGAASASGDTESALQHLRFLQVFLGRAAAVARQDDPSLPDELRAYIETSH